MFFLFVDLTVRFPLVFGHKMSWPETADHCSSGPLGFFFLRLFAFHSIKASEPLFDSAYDIMYLNYIPHSIQVFLELGISNEPKHYISTLFLHTSLSHTAVDRSSRS